VALGLQVTFSSCAHMLGAELARMAQHPPAQVIDGGGD